MTWMSATQMVMLALFGISTLHAAYKAVNQAREPRQLLERELRWRQSKQAQIILDEMEGDALLATEDDHDFGTFAVLVGLGFLQH